MSATANRQIADAIGETLRHGSVFVSGFFYRQHRELEFADGSIAAIDLSFDCSYSDVNTLQESALVEVFADGVSQGTFRYLRMLPDGGDESNWVTLVLGEQ